MPSTANSKTVIARFVSRTKKAEFIAKARKARLQTKDIRFHDAETKPVYINDHLTMENKQLFSKALALKKEHNWQFLWTADCLIKARKTEDSRVFRIRDETDLRVFTSSA